MPILQKAAEGRDLPTLWTFPAAKKEERREEFKGCSSEEGNKWQLILQGSLGDRQSFTMMLYHSLFFINITREIILYLLY